MRNVVLCADDYGMSAGVSGGIVELAAAGRISAMSAMSVALGWPEAARALAPVEGQVGIGLHLAFTWAHPLGPMPGLAPGGVFPSLGLLAKAALVGQLPEPEIAGEIDRQLDSFEAGLGRAPDFVDGHQHVHVLPGIRGPLLRALGRRGWQGRVWLRDPADAPTRILRRGLAADKALAVAALSAGFGRAARRAGFATNRGFSGFSAFDPARDPGPDFARYLVAPGPAHLVMCHPGHVAPGEILDGVAEARARELAYLASDAFPKLLRERRVTLAREPG